VRRKRRGGIKKSKKGEGHEMGKRSAETAAEEGERKPESRESGSTKR